MLTVIIVVLLFIICVYINRNSNYWKEHKVPYEEPIFLFGNLKKAIFGERHLGLIYADIYKCQKLKFKKFPYCGYYKLNQLGVIINDLELIKNILIKDFVHFAANDFQIDLKLEPIWGSNPFFQAGKTWKTIRSSWTSSLTPSRIKNLFESISKTSETIVEHIKRKIEANPEDKFELTTFSAMFFTDAIVSSVFLENDSSFINSNSSYMKVTRSVFSSSLWDDMVVLNFLIAPWTTIKSRIQKNKIINELLKLSKTIINIRQSKGFDKTNPFDSIVLSGGENTIDDDVIAGIIFGFLLDGVETNSGLGGFMLYSLAANSDVQNKLIDEIDKAINENGGKLNFQIIHDLPYLDMVINETLRLYPPLLSAQRVCTETYNLPPIKPGFEPVTIKKGTPVTIPVYVLHMDPEYFPNPEKFDPERFSPENKGNIPKCCYLPFGDGPRTCLGARFGINQTKIMMVNIMRNFTLSLAPQMIGKSIDVDPNIFVYRNVGELWGTFQKRNHN